MHGEEEEVDEVKKKAGSRASREAWERSQSLMGFCKGTDVPKPF